MTGRVRPPEAALDGGLLRWDRKREAFGREAHTRQARVGDRSQIGADAEVMGDALSPARREVTAARRRHHVGHTREALGHHARDGLLEQGLRQRSGGSPNMEAC